jgi:hypothetical protein
VLDNAKKWLRKISWSSQSSPRAQEPLAKGPVRAQEYMVLELEKEVPVYDMDKETQDSIRALAGNTGFEALMRKLRVQRAMLESRLHTEHFKRLEDVFSLQAGIFWLKWLRRQVDMETNRVEPEPVRRPFEVEESDLKKIAEAITLIGFDPQVP